MHAADRLFVDASLTDDGELVIAGQDLGRPGMAEYEYSLRVPAADIPTVVGALGGGPGDDVLALLERDGQQIVRRGEKSWLESLGLRPAFWSRTELD